MMAPSPFRAAQQPLPTCKETRTKEDGWAAEIFRVFKSENPAGFYPTDLAVSTHHHLLSSKHDISRSLQPERVQLGLLRCKSPHLFAVTTQLRTRPVWTPCSSKCCQTSAWSQSRSRSWQGRTVCRLWTAGTTWNTHRNICFWTGSWLLDPRCVEKLTDRCPSRSPPQCLWAFWTGSDTSCRSTGSNHRHRPESGRKNFKNYQPGEILMKTIKIITQESLAVQNLKLKKREKSSTIFRPMSWRWIVATSA